MLDNSPNTVFIGKKPLMTYVNSAIIQLSSSPTVAIKARGLSIAHAVDVVQIILRRTNVFAIGTIKIDSESLESTDGKTRNVSTIEIPVTRTGQ